MMIKMLYEDILAKISEQSGASKGELEVKIKQKCEQLSGLISKEGAAHIVANELGVKLFEKVNGKVTVKEILPGMRDIEVAGKVAAIYEVREFQRQNGVGKVGSFMIMDPTGSIRVVCWGDQTAHLAKMSKGDVVVIKGSYVKDNQNRAEIHCNDQTQLLINPEGVTVDVDVSQASAASTMAATRKPIKDLLEGEQNIELMGAIVQIFDPRFWEACPSCNKRAKSNGIAYVCDEHGEVTPDYSYVMNCFVDDGSDNIRVVFFKNQAQNLCGKSHTEFLGYRENPALFEEVKHELLGQMIKLSGKVQKNTMFDRLEFVSQRVNRPDPAEELQTQ